MMKLTVAFLATLAAADAAQAHGRRHVRRAGADYGNGYGYGAPPAHSLPGTGADASSTVALPATSKLPAGPVGSPSSLPHTSAPALPTGYPTGGSPAAISSSALVLSPSPSENCTSSESAVAVSTKVPLTTAPALPTGYPTGGSPAAISSGLVLSPSENCTTTAAPKSSSPAPSKGTVVTKTSVSEIAHTITETLTYTVGRGEYAHETTTEIVSTSTETMYQTVTITKAQEHPAPTPAAGEQTGTTTVKTTSTTVKYITVYPTPAAPAGPGAPGAGQQGGYPSKAAEQPEGATCAPPVTVTVTAKETVTVTAGTPSYESSTPEEGDVTSTTDITTTIYVTASPVGQPSQAPGKPGNAPAYPTGPAAPAGGYPTGPAAPVYPTGPAAPAYPIAGNGTHPSAPAGYPAGYPAPAPSGFVTSKVPVAPASPTTSCTSSHLPADSVLPSLPVVGESAVPTSEAAKPTSAAPVGYPVAPIPSSAAPVPSSVAPVGYPVAPIPSSVAPVPSSAAPSAPAGGYGYGY